MRCPYCGADELDSVSTERKDRPERAGSPRTILICRGCGEVL